MVRTEYRNIYKKGCAQNKTTTMCNYSKMPKSGVGYFFLGGGEGGRGWGRGYGIGGVS